MTSIRNAAKLAFNLAIGLLLLILSPGFRSLVRAKMRTGSDDPVNTGEQVIVVLKTDTGKTKFIGG